MKEIQEFLRGKKTYIVAFAMVVGYVAACSQGEIDAAEMIEKTLLAILAITLRAGIKNGG